MVHKTADVQSEYIGSNTLIWQYVVVLPGAKIGSECNICSHCFIENQVIIGNRVTIKSGVQIWDGIVIEDDVFVGPNVTFTNDVYPRSKRYCAEYPQTIICQGASVGANSTILPGVCIGEGAMVGAGSVVTKSVPAGELWYGNPAMFKRKLESDNEIS